MSKNTWPFMPELTPEQEAKFAAIREATKDALSCPHCDALYCLDDALDEDSGKYFCPECENEITDINS